jgi:molybdopterin synthase sulfur carrier subunit
MDNKISIKLFGNLSELINAHEIVIDFKPTFFELKAELYLQFPMLEKQEFVFAINQKITHENSIINQNAEIALLPPFSGG